MKRLALAVSVLLLAFGFWGCAGGGGEGAELDALVELASEELASDVPVLDGVAQEETLEIAGEPENVGEDVSQDLAETEDTPPLSTFACLSSPDCHRLIIVAHRGFHVTYPENSLAALRAAAEAGVPMAEVDVRETLDGALVLMHDDTVNRTTDGSGAVNELTLAEIQELTLAKSDEDVPESVHVPTFQQALELAEETGIVLYVDQKTGRWDLVLEAVAGGGFYEQAMIRDGLGTIELMAAEDPNLFVMPAVEGTLLLEGAISTIPDLRIVELSQGSPDAAFGAYARERNIKVQQDVIVCDIFATLEDYSCWKSYVDAGVQVLQSDFAHILNPIAQHYNQTGEW